MGLGLFGGGVAATDYFARRGAQVLVTDRRSRAELAESIAKLHAPYVSFHLGGHRTADFTDTDLVVANPAVPIDNEFLEAARDAGVPIDAEMNLFFKACRAPIIGVTGSNGKSTTAALIAHILTAAGHHCHLGGNIGRPLLGEVERIAAEDVVVLEISSFQLEYLHGDRLSPHAAVVMNLKPNHLDRHETMENYASIKQHILEHQSAGDVGVLNADDARVRPMPTASGVRRVLFSTRTPVEEGAWLEGDTVRCSLGGQETIVHGLDGVKLIGPHNRENICAAVAVAAVMGVAPKSIEKALPAFEPLPHRLQKVAEHGGVTYVNDSIATNPDAAAAALACYEGNVLLIAGGSPKDIGFDPLVGPVVEKVKLLLLIGETGGEIEAAVRSADAERPEILHAGTLERAVAIARERAEPGDVVLLSPACASYDQFRNFEKRGERFTQLALQAE